ncbi:hypothetical protein GCM10010344_07810 [Streptomyces bluensis]|nr:hypothetical protein GCM10010344_07810 [Streptomyces bluensis]
MANNQLNWQWMAGTGAGTRPHRVLSPSPGASGTTPAQCTCGAGSRNCRNAEGNVVHEPWKRVAKEHAGTCYPAPGVSLAEGLDPLQAGPGTLVTSGGRTSDAPSAAAGNASTGVCRTPPARKASLP